MSSHLVSDLERICDYLVVLVASRVQVAGEVETLLASHYQLTGPRCDPATLPADWQVISASHTDRQSTLLVRSDTPDRRPGLDGRPDRPGRPGARLHEPGQPPGRRAAPDNRPPWRPSDDLADLAAVPHPGDRGRLRARRPRDRAARRPGSPWPTCTTAAACPAARPNGACAQALASSPTSCAAASTSSCSTSESC